MSKSDGIQHKYRELPLEPQLLSGFANEDLGEMSSEHLSDEIQDLYGKLFQRLLWIIENGLTKRQTEIVKMIYLEQMTQTQVARVLGLCQPSVQWTQG